jgi:hypothetical protein
MDLERLAWAAGIGAMFGIAVVAARAWTVRLLDWQVAQAASRSRAPPLLWPTDAVIVAASIAIYGFVGTYGRPGNAVAPSATVAVASSDLPAGPAQIDIGGATLSFDPPDGYCLYPAPLLNSVLTQQAKVNPDNSIDAVFGNCDQLRAALEGQSQERIRDFGLVMTPKAPSAPEFDQAALDRTVTGLVDATTVKATLDQRLAKAASNLKLQSFATLGMLDRDERAAYFAYLSRTDSANGSYDQACIMAMTALKGRRVSYYLYADYGENSGKDARATLFGLLQKANAGIGDLIERNR